MIIKNYKQLAKTKDRKIVLDIINEGLEACKSERIIKENISLKKNKLTIKNKSYYLDNYKGVYLIGFGKMSSSVAKEIEKIIPIKKGIVIDTEYTKLKKVEVIKGTHPLPSKKNIIATKKIIDLVSNLSEQDLVICISSGGGSSLLCYPNLDFDEYMKKLKKVIYSGINIVKLNKFRKKYSNVKAGRLANSVFPTKLVNLYFSDVVGDKLEVIASGPTYDKRADNILLLNNKVGIEAMKKKAESFGFKTIIICDKFKGYSKNYGVKLLEKIKNKRNICLISGCETTVKVIDEGKGGRNQELSLGSIDHIGEATLVAVDSDGIDGVTDAAGAIVDKEIFYIASSLKLDPLEYLKENNSYDFLKKTKNLIYTGKTGINVMDFVVILKR
jgi:glycerate-2-kinase